MATTTSLSDEEAVTYPLKGASGLTPGEKCYIPKSGSMTFQLRFTPLPKDTRIFDLVEGAGQDLFRIYGIHDTRTKVKIPVAKETVDTEETDESLFRKGKAWVRGRIEDYSRRPDNGLLFFNFSTFGQTQIEPYALTRQCTAIRPDGTFSAELSVDHPVWADISLHQETLPFYVRPGDTLDITMRTIDGRLCADYASSHPKGCYDRLLKHQDVPVIYYSWEQLTQDGQAGGNEAFLKRVDECVEENMRLCDYMAWKYKFSPWETHLLKNRQRLLLAENHLLLASRLFQRQVAFPQNHPQQKEDFTGYDYSAYKVLNVLPQNDPSLSFLPRFNDFPTWINLMVPMTYAERYAALDSGADKALRRELLKDSLQVEILRQLMGTDGTPWTMQAFLAAKACRMDIGLSPSQRTEAIKRLSAYLTISYFKTKIRELDSLAARSASWVYDMADGAGREEVERIIAPYKGKYVHAIWLSSPAEDSRFLQDAALENLLLDAEDFPDLQLVMIVNRDAYSEGSDREQLTQGRPLPVLHWTDDESFLRMQELFRTSSSPMQITFDRNGLVFKQSFDMRNETAFRQQYRYMLHVEKNMW